MADPITAAVAVGWGLQAVGWIASPIMSEIFKKGSSFLGFDASEKLKELEPKVLLLERVMEAVEESPDRPRLEQLFKDLKTAFYEAEDILDDVEYHRLKKQIQDGKLKSDGDVPIRMRDLMKKKLSSGIPSSSSNDQVFFLPTELECVLISVKPTTFLCHQGSLEFMLYRPYSQLGGQLVANKIFISLQGITIVMNNIFHVFAIFS
jgi:hypothetical protein